MFFQQLPGMQNSSDSCCTSKPLFFPPQIEAKMLVRQTQPSTFSWRKEELFHTGFRRVMQLPAQGRWWDFGFALVTPGQGWAVPGLTGALCGREIIQSGGLGLAVGREGE